MPPKTVKKTAARKPAPARSVGKVKAAKDTGSRKTGGAVKNAKKK